MQYDVALVAGLLAGLLSLPLMVSAFSSDRSPRGAILMLAMGGLLILYATLANPAGYRAGELPDVVLRVIAAIIR